MKVTGHGWHYPEFAALGKIVVRFAQLEWCIEHMLKGFMRPEAIAILMCTGENTSWKLDKLAAIATEVVTDPPAKMTLLNWIKAARILVSRRNKLMPRSVLSASQVVQHALPGRSGRPVRTRQNTWGFRRNTRYLSAASWARLGAFDPEFAVHRARPDRCDVMSRSGAVLSHSVDW
jgi:hypothetical protein